MAQLVRALSFSARGPRLEICTGPKKSTDWFTRVVCLGKALYSHLSHSPERIREVSFVGEYYNLSADRECT